MVARLTNIFLHPVFIGCIVLYSLIRYLRRIEFAMPDWLNGQVTDLLCIPVVLMICLAFVRVIKKNATIELKLWLIGLICLEYALIFEWMLPKKSAIYTADWLDVCMYFTGGLIFYFIQPLFRPKQKNQKPVNS
ncbi:MAG: hypothetical protein HYZ14_10215 [Bacteroidetes bacterium]|nr:hypothetical protein [Bacteroidota bacterium]